MRDFRDAKAMAQTLRAALAAMDLKITVSQSLELIAQAFGVADWNTLSAAIRAEATAVPEEAPRPPPTAESVTTAGRLPMPGLSGQLESTLNQVFVYAKGRKHEEITVEHLLLFLLDDAEASPVMQAVGVDLDEMRKELTDYLDKELKSQGAGGGDIVKPAVAFQRVLQRAVFHVHTAGRDTVGSRNVLVAMFSEKESQAVNLLNEQGVTRSDVVNYIARGDTKGGGDAEDGPTST